MPSKCLGSDLSPKKGGKGVRAGTFRRKIPLPCAPSGVKVKTSKRKAGSWRDDSAVKTTYCSSKGLGFHSGSSRPFVTLVPGGPMLGYKACATTACQGNWSLFKQL